jgi:hypothetical protein
MDRHYHHHHRPPLPLSAPVLTSASLILAPLCFLTGWGIPPEYREQCGVDAGLAFSLQ